ncbi:MAG: right-handed parallel beta-helix repeat-containing protein [Gammaproteobacteria bacterium]|nr:right-handed parallel beta-helix repeat-containing protein [Gammaproteobacteria bacterium]
MVYIRSFFLSVALVMTFVSHCWAVSVPSDKYRTIQAAITALENNSILGDTINVARGEYSENLVLSGAATIVIKGEETAATFLDARDRGRPILSISNASSNVTVRNFTFRTGNRGIVLINSSGVIIASNIFRLGNNGDAISSDAFTDANIINNTFYDNNRAVDQGGETTVITNNIFNNNNVAISPDTLTEAVSYNCFNDNNDNGVTGTQVIINRNPLFVNISLNDFHLKENSPCIDEGSGTDIIDSSTADMGAYGGDYADVFPFKVQNVAVSDVLANVGTPAIAVTWSANESYRVTHTTSPGGYKLYYDSDQSGSSYDGSDASEGISPIDVDNVTSYTISGLTPPNIIPAAPTISNVIPSKSQTLDVYWGSVASATGYRLYYGVNDHNENQIDVGTVTNYSLSGLTNGVIYNIAVSALHQATYYLSVTAYGNTATSSLESGYSDERSLDMGSEKESVLSAILPGIPEAVVPFPLLPDEGCFIATAAFGYYDAPQVQLLRDFRDHYLLSHSPGEWFVKQYYIHSPRAARYIERHPEWKSAVRLALLPLIAMAWVLFNVLWLAQVVVISGGIMFGVLYLRRKRRKLAASSHAREIFS